MNLTTKNNLRFMIEKVSCGGNTTHLKNNLLTKLSLISIKNRVKAKRLESDCINFIIKNNKLS